MTNALNWTGLTGANPQQNAIVSLSDDLAYIVVFKVGGRHFGLPLARVVRAFRMVALTPLPDAPAWVSGVFNLHGQVIQAVSLRQRLGLPPQEIRLSDRLLLVTGHDTPFALIVDQIIEVMAVSPDQFSPIPETTPELNLVEAIIEQPEFLVLVLNATRLSAALKG